MVPANFSDLAEKVRPGVVNIQVVKKVKNVALGFGATPLETRIPSEISSRTLLRGQSALRKHKQQGVGSGFVISQDGYILTNNHVVEDADQIKVKLANGKEYDGKVVEDTKTDLGSSRSQGPRTFIPSSSAIRMT